MTTRNHTAVPGRWDTNRSTAVEVYLKTSFTVNHSKALDKDIQYVAFIYQAIKGKLGSGVHKCEGADHKALVVAWYRYSL